jgi:hypothetical protein
MAFEGRRSKESKGTNSNATKKNKKIETTTERKDAFLLDQKIGSSAGRGWMRSRTLPSSDGINYPSCSTIQLIVRIPSDDLETSVVSRF